MAEPSRPTDPALRRLRIAIRGAVQGVGFRPFVYRLASELSLAGWVLNSAQGVFLEVEGGPDALATFRRRLEAERPAHSVIHSLEAVELDPAGFDGFEIRHSDDAGEKSVAILPDLATCEDCLRELFDPADRRFRYPFINCTHCGPRYSIVLGLPYDRPNTTMRGFALCEECRREYDDPLDRRFHAQPVACPACGPRLIYCDRSGRPVAERDDALLAAAEAVRQGRIVAIKGLGGYQLVCDARNEAAVRTLRERKRREEKPLAVMLPSLDAVREHCVVTAAEAQLLQSAQSPIVLLERRRPARAGLAPSVVPGAGPATAGGAHAYPNPTLGVMLPYTPLHHLLMRDLGHAIVATSGNLSDEPICIDDAEALQRLAGVADAFLMHDRPIARHVDDSVVRVLLGREQVLRRARGYAPSPPPATVPPGAALAVGAQLKSTVAVATGGRVFLSQHIGDLDNVEAFSAFRRVTADLQSLYDLPESRIVAHDLHPDYLSTRAAAEMPGEKIAVQHHYAHVLACMADNDLKGPVLGVSWDGTGYGLDGSVWGGEFLRVDEAGFERVARLRPFRLPGGEAAIKEPRRAALGVLFELPEIDLEAQAELLGFGRTETRALVRLLRSGRNAPLTSSAGRLFDAVAALVGLRGVARHEGQAAMELEFAASASANSGRYPMPWVDGAPATLDWGPCIRSIVDAVRIGVPPPVVAGRFHRTLSRAVVCAAEHVGERRVVLTGGCFQNRLLTRLAVLDLRAAGFEPVWHQRIPPNDGGIAVGQAVAALRQGRRRT